VCLGLRLVDPRSNDGQKLIGIQAGPADEGAIHAGLAEEGSGVFRLDAAAVLNHKRLGRFVVEYLTEAVPNKFVRLVSLLGSEIGAEPPSAMAEFLIAIAGPIVNLILAIFFTLAEHPVVRITPLHGLVEYLAYINFALVLFNLIPGYPLDGGRVFHAIVWGVTHDMCRATLVAANVGRIFGFIFIMYGVF
jgi:Peptidase family M50